MLQTKETIKNILLVVIGNFLLALSVEMFVLPYNVLSGGLAGISVALYPLFHFDQDMVIIVLTVVFFILGYIILGKSFAVKTVLSSICYPVFIAVLAKRVPVVEVDPMLASAYAGILAGAGVGLALRAGASTGGMDIPPLILHKFTRIPISTLILVVDALTVLLGVVTYGLSNVLVGLISVYTSSVVIDKVSTMRGNQAKEVLIISDHWQEISETIQRELERGTTILQGKGGYEGADKQIVMSIVKNNQYNHLMKLIDKIDKDAFIISNDTMEIKGEGFTNPFKI